MDLNDLQAFRAWFAARASVAATGAAVKSGPLPDSPDRCISVMDYDPGRTTPNWQGHYRVQIRCRGVLPSPTVSTYNDCHVLADAAVAAVAPAQDDPVIATLNGGRRAIVTRIGDVMPMGPDSKGRWEMTVNVALDYSRV